MKIIKVYIFVAFCEYKYTFLFFLTRRKKMLSKLILLVSILKIAYCDDQVQLLKPEDGYIQELARFATEKINKENLYESEGKPNLALIRVTKASKDGNVYDLNIRLKEANCKRNCVIDICDVKISLLKEEKIMERRKCSLVKARPRN